MSFAPVVHLGLALIFMIITMILVGTYLRRNEYEDYDIKLPKEMLHLLSTVPDTVNLYRLNGIFQNYNGIKINIFVLLLKR